jgi:hypothetical protein
MTTISATAVNPTNITISWTALTDTTLNGRDVPERYHVEVVFEVNYDDWREEGFTTGLSFTYAPGGVCPSGFWIAFRVWAENGVGWG